MPDNKDRNKDIFDFDTDVFKFDSASSKSSASDKELDDIIASVKMDKTTFSDDDKFWDDSLYKDIFNDSTKEKSKPQITESPLDSATRTMPIKTQKDLRAVVESERRRNMPPLQPRRPVTKNDDEDVRVREPRVRNSRPPEQPKERKVGRKPVRRKKFRLTGVRYVLFVLVVSIILAGVGWIAANDVFALNKSPRTAIVTIPEDYSIGQVASILKKNGIIEYKILFQLFGAVAKADKKIDAGTYKLTTDLDYRAIVSRMQEGSSDEIVKVTIPEGKTMTEIFEILQNEGVCSADKLKEIATDHEFEYKFLDSSTIGNEKRLEGYLFPDTYEFYLSDNAVDVINKMLKNFDNKVTDAMYEKAKTLGYSMHEIITVASLIEKEAASADEADYVASVIYNRLNSSDFPYLQIDATIQYILPQRKEKLTEDDLKIESPYNTYYAKGMPPGPISCPGISSIGAALNPANTKYYFYALDKGGFHQFFSNADSFDNFVNSDDYGG